MDSLPGTLFTWSTTEDVPVDLFSQIKQAGDSIGPEQLLKVRSSTIGPWASRVECCQQLL